MLLTPRAEAQGLDRPWQFRGGWCQRQHLADYLERLTGLAVAVDLVRIRREQKLTSCGGDTQAIALFSAHGRNFT